VKILFMVQTYPHSVEFKCPIILLVYYCSSTTTVRRHSEVPWCEPIQNPIVGALGDFRISHHFRRTDFFWYIVHKLVDDFREKRLFLRDEYPQNRKLESPIKRKG
jgi:hypothetical protein